MAQNDYQHMGRHGTPVNRTIQNQPTNSASVMASEEDLIADVDEPPDLERTPRPSGLKLHDSFKRSFQKTRPTAERKESLLTNALHSDSSPNSPTEDHASDGGPRRGLSWASTWSNNSVSTAELTSDGGLTSPGTRTSTPSPPPPSGFHGMAPVFNKAALEQPVSVVRNDDDHVGPLQKGPTSAPKEENVEVSLGRKRCITFACGGRKEPPKPTSPSPQVVPEQPAQQPEEPPKRACTIKFACPSKISTDAPSKTSKPRITRTASPAPPPQPPQRSRASPRSAPKVHRGSDSTVRNPSPVSVRKWAPAKDRTRRLSTNSDLARCEAYRFHEFASSEEEEDEWLQESTCHRNRLTISDTLKIENSLRKLGEEAEEEAIDDEEEEDEDLDDDDDDDEDEADLDDEDHLARDDGADEDLSDEGFQTDDEDGFANSDDESDAGSDFDWWAPGAGASTAATSTEHLEHIRPSGRRSVSESSLGSMDSEPGFHIPDRMPRRKKSRPVNIRVPSPELPDSTDFVCGTLDEDRPLEAAYLTCLERRRAAKHKVTPQDIDPTFPTSDPEMEEEDEDSDHGASESDAHLMVHGQMDTLDVDFRGRSMGPSKKRSPAQSPKRLRSPPPTKRAVHRSPPPRKLFGQSPRRLRSPAPGVRLRSPPPTRRGSSFTAAHQQGRGMTIGFTGLAQRPALTTSSSLPRTPGTAHPSALDEDEDTCRESMSVRRAIDIKIGLENKRQRRKEQQYKKAHRKGAKDAKCPPGKGCEQMRKMGIGLAAHKGKTYGFGFAIAPTPDQKDMHVLSV